jgi:peptidylprolyl isomerase
VHTRRTPVRLLLPAVLLTAAAALAGCGSGSSSGSSDAGSGSSFDSVKVSGDVGSAATIAFNGQVTDQSTSTKVLTEGTGPVVENGDDVVLQTVIADGYTQKTVADSYHDQAPQVVPLSDSVPSIFRSALEGKKVGTRVAIYAPADKIFGAQGNPTLQIGNKDAVVLVLDIVGKPLDGPDGASHRAPSWAPAVVEKKGVVSGLDFSGTPKPDGKLHVTTLRSGTGDTVKSGQTIIVDYLGAVYRGKKPFDENFSSDPVSFQIGTGKVIPGWDKALVGQKVGSRVLVEIPPKEGYGNKAQSGIPANSTLYFVVDILGAF